MRILNLEDNDVDAELNAALITARWPKCELVRVSNGADYVAALDGGKWNLVLSDYSVYGISGLEALTLAQARMPGVPFLYVSGTIGEDAAIEALKSGATDYVLKHRLARLIPAMERAMAEARERAERERAEEAMRESEHKYRTLFECMADAVILADHTTGKILDANPRAELLLRCGRGELLGRNERDFLPQENGNGNGDPANPTRCPLIRLDGSVTQVEVRTTRFELYDHALELRLCHEVRADDARS